MQRLFKFRFSYEGCMRYKTVGATSLSEARKQIENSFPEATKIMSLGASAVQS